MYVYSWSRKSSDFTRLLYKSNRDKTFEDMVASGGLAGYVHLCSKSFKKGGYTDMNKMEVRLYQKIVRNIIDFLKMRRRIDINSCMVVIITPPPKKLVRINYNS